MFEVWSPFLSLFLPSCSWGKFHIDAWMDGELFMVDNLFGNISWNLFSVSYFPLKRYRQFYANFSSFLVNLCVKFRPFFEISIFGEVYSCSYLSRFLRVCSVSDFERNFSKHESIFETAVRIPITALPTNPHNILAHLNPIMVMQNGSTIFGMESIFLGLFWLNQECEDAWDFEGLGTEIFSHWED